MKKLVLIGFFGLLLCTAFKTTTESVDHITEKQRVKLVTDYRDAYVGNYFCKRSTTSFMADRFPTVTKDTITISVAKDALDSIMVVSISGKTLQFKLISGMLFGYPQGLRHTGKFFATDSLRMYIPTGHASSAMYYGKKN